MSTAPTSPDRRTEPEQDRPGGYAPPQAPGAGAAPQAHSSKAGAALVLGIFGAIGALLIPIAGIVLGILAIVFGRQARAEALKPGQAKAGVVLGIVALVFAVANIVVTVIIAT